MAAFYYMVQYDAHGRFVRRAVFNAVLYGYWIKQVPYGRIVVE